MERTKQLVLWFPLLFQKYYTGDKDRGDQYSIMKAPKNPLKIEMLLGYSVPFNQTNS